MKPLSPLSILSLLSVAVLSPALTHAAAYNVYKAGLYDSSTTAISHTDSNGKNNSNFSSSFSSVSFNAVGDAVGTSMRYLPNSTLTAGVNAWYFDSATHLTTLIGLVDAAHTSVTTTVGTQSSSIYGVNSNGEVAGTSALYGPSGSLGNSGWFFKPGSGTVQIGFYTAGPDTFTPGYANTATGAVSTSINGIDNAGHVTGTSNRYIGQANGGASAFYYDPTVGVNGTSTIIGLTTGVYDDGTGVESSTVLGMNANGQVTGTSFNNSRGYNDAYFYNPAAAGGSARIGLVNDSTYNAAVVTLINNAAVAGYIGLKSNTNSHLAWVYNITSGSSVQAGLTDAAHTGTVSGINYSNISALNTAGQAIGSTNLYATENGVDTNVGSDAFFFNGTSTVAIGLNDALHTASPILVSALPYPPYRTSYTQRTNTASFLNNVGQVVGTSARFNTVSNVTTQVGTNAWFYSSTLGTVTIGLTDAAPAATPTAVSHTGSDGTPAHGLTQTSTVNAINDLGQAIGNSTRYVQTTSGNTTTFTAKGTDGYLYSASSNTSIQIGLTDSVHVGSDSSASTFVSFLTQSGLVAGTSARYVSNSASTNGRDVWLYDSNTQMTYTITPSISGTNYANAAVYYLSETGLVLGTFTVESGSGIIGNTDLFAYQEGQSIIDLGQQTTDLTTSGWQNLANLSFSFGNAAGDVAATGLLTGEPIGSSAALVFIPNAAVVPEPASLGILAVGSLLLLRKRKSL